VRAGSFVPAPSSRQAGPGLAARAAGTWHPDLAHAIGPQLHHHSNAVPAVAIGRAWASRHGRSAIDLIDVNAIGIAEYVGELSVGDGDGATFVEHIHVTVACSSYGEAHLLVTRWRHARLP
jgi:hypothetical protein